MNVPFGGPNYLEPVALAEISDPVEGSPEYANAVARDETTRDITALTWLPQLPEGWADEIYERIELRERSLVAPNRVEDDYLDGTAAYPDEIARVRTDSDGRYVFSAEHATKPISILTGKARTADTGTGGLAAIAGEDFGTALILRGKQTTNVPSVEEHPLKASLIPELAQADGFLSIHGKNPGMFVRPSDRSEVHACLGLGPEPSELLREFAGKIALAAKDDLGLYVVISNDQKCYIQKPRGTELKRNDDGSVKQSQLAALKPNMTKNFSQRVLTNFGRNVPSLQIELTDLLRLTPLDRDDNKGIKSRIIGVALGYKLIEKIVALSPLYSQL